MTSNPTLAFSIREFCARYAIGRTKAYAEISSRRLRAVKVGRRTLITEADAQTWLATLPALKPSCALTPLSKTTPALPAHGGRSDK
jgi:excisionase family DNA binding protein